MPCNRLLSTYSLNISKQFNGSKICERINYVSSVTQNATNSCLISWPARLAKSWVLQTIHVRFSVLVNHAK